MTTTPERTIQKIHNGLQIDGRTEVIGAESVTVIHRDANGNVLLATGATVPTAATAGYAKGAKFIDTDVATGYNGSYINVGTSSSCTFVSESGETVQAVTATVAGDGTGVIEPQTTHATVTSSVSTKIVTLPAPVVGKKLVVDVGANGCKLQTTAPETIGINGGTGASAVSAVAANSTIELICVSLTSWKAIFWDADSDVAKLPAAA